jgi:hypothetical protein
MSALILMSCCTYEVVPNWIMLKISGNCPKACYRKKIRSKPRVHIYR